MRRCRRTSPAGQPDVDWDDPAQEPVDGVEGNAGDSVLIYGNAMMDTEHAQYFEIHPVRAYYVMGKAWPQPRDLESQRPEGASDRSNYDYSKKELGEIAVRIAELSRGVRVVHAVMNNNYEDQGQRNAKTLAALLNARLGSSMAAANRESA